MANNVEPGSGGGNSGVSAFLTPVFLTALLILLGVFFVIGMTIFGWDKGGVLTSMAKIEYARGLITYLFAVVTIGTAVVLVVSALSSITDPQSDQKFQRAKEILALLLGVFGTIVGYYFGSEKTPQPALRLIAPELIPAQVNIGGTFIVTTAVVGGTPPYLYKTVIDTKTLVENQPVKEGGLIVYESKKADLANVAAGVHTVIVSVTDSTSRVTSAENRLEVLASERKTDIPPAK